MDKYVRLQKTVDAKTEVFPADEYFNKLKLQQHIKKSPGSDWYTSLFVLGKEAKELYDRTGSIRDYKGPAYSKSLVWDLDCKQDVNKAKDDVRKLLKALQELGVKGDKRTHEYCKVFFSGNKGFHVYLYTDEEFTPTEMKSICSRIAKDIDTFDSVIYNSTRLFRVENTKHAKSGLYKIELDPLKLKNMSMDDIKQLAKKPGQFSTVAHRFSPKGLFDGFRNAKPERSKPVFSNTTATTNTDDVRGIHDIDFKKCPKTRPKCIHALSEGIMVPGRGERDHIFLHLGNYYRNTGMGKEAVYGALKGIARQHNTLYPDYSEPMTKEELHHQIIPRVFNGKFNANGWGVDPEDEIFRRYCSMLPRGVPCPIHDKSNKEIVKISDVSNSFANFAENFDKNRVLTGIDFIDDNMKITIGITTLLIGAPGCGKTTLCLNMMENANKLGFPTMFFSLDMHKTLIYLRLAQKVTRYKQNEILNFYKSKDRSKIKDIEGKIEATYPTTYFDFTGTLTLEDMKKRIEEVEAKNDTKIKLVIVDYASRISGPYSDAYANAKHNALLSKSVADDTESAWLILNQVSRNTGDGSTPLRSKRAAKDAGDWEESARNVITMWRPYMGMQGKSFIDPETETEIPYVDDIMRIFLAKNTMGPELEQPLYWDGAKGIVRDFTPEELDEYLNDREYLEREAYRSRYDYKK